MARGMLSADARNPQMGLHNVVCADSVYWCRLHEVWLSEEDVTRKGCNAKHTLDMIATRRCGNIEKKEFYEWHELVMPNKKKKR